MSIKIGIGINMKLSSGSVPPVPAGHTLELEFDNIANASGMIGGDATLLSDWNTAFGSPASPFTAITVVGNTVTLSGGANITVPDSLFSTDWDDYGHLISIVDTGCIVAAGYNSFGDYDYESNGIILVKAILPAMVTAGEGCFYEYNGNGTLITVDFRSLETAGDYCFYYHTELVNANFTNLITAGKNCFNSCSKLNTDFSALTTAGDNCFNGCTGLINPDFSSLVTAGDNCFNGCTGLINPDFSSLTTAPSGCFAGCTGLNTDFSSLTTAGDNCFYGCTSFTTMNLPVLTSLGTTVGDDNVFLNIINKTITLTIPAALMTCNAGSTPDGDIQWLTDVAQNNTVTIIQV